MKPFRWILTNICGATIGVAVGTGAAFLISFSAAQAMGFNFLAWDPVDERQFPTIVFACILGGALGGAAGYVGFQKLNHLRVPTRHLAAYVFLGACLWPLVAICDLILFFGLFIEDSVYGLFMNLPVTLGPTAWLLFAFAFSFVLLPGIALGLIMAFLRRAPDIFGILAQRRHTAL